MTNNHSAPRLHGLLLVDKEAGCTSHDVVRDVRRLLGEKKIGHCGTLDPEATGLLLLTVGQSTRLTRFLIKAPKVYEGSIRFGAETDTYDASGQVMASGSTSGLSLAAIEDAMLAFVGAIDQMPPPYCAKKVKGVKYYELARQGLETPRDAKPVTVHEFRATSGLEDDRLAFQVSCSSGTYARSLAHDLGKSLGNWAHLESLRRLQVGPFRLQQASTIEALGRQLSAGVIADLDSWIPFDRIPLPFGEISTDARQERRITHGQTVLVNDYEGEEGDWVKVLNSRDEFVAVGTVIERLGSDSTSVVQPKIVFRGH